MGRIALVSSVFSDVITDSPILEVKEQKIRVIVELVIFLRIVSSTPHAAISIEYSDQIIKFSCFHEVFGTRNLLDPGGSSISCNGTTIATGLSVSRCQKNPEKDHVQAQICGSGSISKCNISDGNTISNPTVCSGLAFYYCKDFASSELSFYNCTLGHPIALDSFNKNISFRKTSIIECDSTIGVIILSGVEVIFDEGYFVKSGPAFFYLHRGSPSLNGMFTNWIFDCAVSKIFNIPNSIKMNNLCSRYVEKESFSFPKPNQICIQSIPLSHNHACNRFHILHFFELLLY